MVGNDGQFARFGPVAGQPGWAADARFATNPHRVAQRSTLIPMLRQATVTRTTRAWVLVVLVWGIVASLAVVVVGILIDRLAA